MNWGLVIQGPVVSFGQGPNNVVSGFSAREVIRTNIKNFTPYVSQILVSTWEDSGLDFRGEFSSKVALIENKLPSQIDHDNRIKQFVSTYTGVKFLTLNSPATHILKIRTDQLVDPEIIRWLNEFFLSSVDRFNPRNTLQESFLVFSEIRKDSPFYAGDYIFAGTSKDLLAFCRANLGYGARKLHPSVGVDYILKHLSINDKPFKDCFYRRIPLLWQTSNLTNRCVQSYWADILQTRFSVMPKFIFSTIVWRERLMTDILPPNILKGFSFFEDLAVSRASGRKPVGPKSLRFLIPTRQVFRVAKYEYVRYWKSILKFFLRQKLRQ